MHITKAIKITLLAIAAAQIVMVDMVVALVEKETPLILDEVGKKPNLIGEQRP
jgi:hypothetical protein